MPEKYSTGLPTLAVTSTRYASTLPVSSYATVTSWTCSREWIDAVSPSVRSWPHRTGRRVIEREQRDEALLAREVLLVAEAAAHVGRDHAHRLLVEPARLRDDGAQLVRLLVRREHLQHTGRGVERGLRAVALQRQRGDAVVREAQPARVRRGRERVGERRRQHGEPEELVGPPLGIQERRSGAERGERIDHDGQRIVVDDDQLQRVLRDRAAGRDDRRDRLPDEPHPVAREHSPLERDAPRAAAAGASSDGRRRRRGRPG